MKDIVASFAVGIEAGEQSIEGEFPLAFGFVLVLEVVLFELGADIDGSFQLSAHFSDVLSPRTQSSGNHTAVDVLISAGDDLVAGLLDEHDQSWRGVVVLAELVNLEEGVHDGREKFRKGGELASVIAKLGEEFLEG